MRRVITALTGVLALAGVGSVLAAGAGATPGDVTCTGTIASGFTGHMNVPHNLIIPSGRACGPTQGSTIGHDVIVQPGGAFYPGGTTIGHDVRATGAAMIELGDVNNGTTQTVIKHDVIIKQTTGPMPYGNFICQSRIGHNLLISGSKSNASGWDVGYADPPNCGRNSQPGVNVGHNATFRQNATSMLVGQLKVRGKLTFRGNRGSQNLLVGNYARRGCRRSRNRAYSGYGNRVGRHRHNNCNATSGGRGIGGR